MIHQSRGSEASKLYKIKGQYYHFYSEVTPEGHQHGDDEPVDELHRPYENCSAAPVDERLDREPNEGRIVQAPYGAGIG